MINAATSLVVNNNHIDKISFWMSFGTSVGFMLGAGRGGGLHCLSFFHYSCKLGKKAFTVHFDPRVPPNCNGENGFEYHQGCWYRGFVNMDEKGYCGISYCQYSVVGNAGDWGNQLSLLLVSASRPREIPMW